MDWPTAFLMAVLFVSVFAYMAYNNHVRAEIMKEAIRNGIRDMKID